MKLLAIETSGKLCGACLIENDSIIDILEQENGLTHSESLMPLIDKLLKQNSITISQIDGFVCDIGPGSFTGIRIGVATAKAFVDSCSSAKYTGVSSLEALAYNVTTSETICSIIDCKNDNCYYALYSFKNGVYSEIVSPTAASIYQMTDYLQTNFNSSITFVGDGAITYKEHITKNYNNAVFSNQNNINTLNLALAGFKKISYGNTIELSPMYLKKPQAERQLEEKSKITICKMNYNDLEKISNILITDFDEFWTENVLKQELSSSTSDVFVAKNLENEIVGFACIQFVLEEATITNIVTKKNYRRNGIGKALLQHLITISRKNNMNSITLEVNENNVYAIKLYESFDFKRVGLRKNYYNNKDNAIIMTLYL